MTQLRVIKPEYYHDPTQMAFEDNEKLIIGACLIDRINYDMIRAILKSQDFYFARYRIIMESMQALEQSGQQITPLTVAGNLKEKDKLTEVGGVTLLLGYKRYAKEHPEIDYLPAAVAIKEAAMRINLLVTGDNIKKLAMRRDLNISVIETSTRNYVDETFKTLTTRAIPKLTQAVSEYYDLKDQAENGNIPSRIYTGLHDLDNPSLLGGFKRKDLVMIGAESSMGKTAFAVTVTNNMSNDGRKGLFISMEMDEIEMAQRFIAAQTGISLLKLRPYSQHDIERMTADWRKEVTQTPAERNQVLNFMASPTLDNIGLIHKPTLTALEVWSEIRRFKLVNDGIDFCVVDLITNMTADERDKDQNRAQELTQIAGTLKEIAQTEDLTMIVLSQVSGQVQQRANKRPLEGDFRDSKGIGFQADIQIFIYRHSRYDMTAERNEAEILVRKHRSGAIGARKVRFDEQPARFRNMEK